MVYDLVINLSILVFNGCVTGRHWCACTNFKSSRYMYLFSATVVWHHPLHTLVIFVQRVSRTSWSNHLILYSSRLWLSFACVWPSLADTLNPAVPLRGRQPYSAPFVPIPLQTRSQTIPFPLIYHRCEHAFCSNAGLLSMEPGFFQDQIISEIDVTAAPPTVQRVGTRRRIPGESHAISLFTLWKMTSRFGDF